MSLLCIVLRILRAITYTAPPTNMYKGNRCMLKYVSSINPTAINIMIAALRLFHIASLSNCIGRCFLKATMVRTRDVISEVPLTIAMPIARARMIYLMRKSRRNRGMMSVLTKSCYISHIEHCISIMRATYETLTTR